MQRSSFLKSCMAAFSFLSLPFSGTTKSKVQARADKGFKVDAGKDRFDKSISLFEGDTFYSKVSGADTDGDMFVFESTRIKKGGPTFHYHYTQDEWWYVLEGEFLFKVGDKTFETKVGDSIFGPRGVPHAFAKINEGNAKLLMIFQPAGKMEIFFQKISEGATSKLSEEEKINFRKEHGIKTVGPALIYHKQ